MITDGDREFIVSFANQIAIALENAVLYRKLEVSERKYRGTGGKCPRGYLDYR